MQLHDTVITLSPAQRKRLIQGYDGSFAQARPWDFDVFAGAGAIRSTASDMLTYLDANMHPEKYTAGAAPGSAAATLTEAIALDHEARAEAGPDGKIALAWFIDSKTHSLNHNGGTGGYGSFAQFNADQDWAMVALYNRDGPFPRFVDRVGDNVSELLSGQPSVRVDQLADEDKKALAYPVFANSSIHGSYHCRLTAFPLPATAKDPFNAAASGDIHVLADGKGGFSQGTWEHRITAPTLNIHLRREELSPSS
jgi:CubicO group peptidase (beta-lactamase class C family)